MFPLIMAVSYAATVQVSRVDQVPDRDAHDPAWQAAPSTEVPVMAQVVTYPQNHKASITSVGVRALADSRWLAVRLEWVDATKDEQVEVDNFTDAVAVQIPLGDPKSANPMMGAKGNPMYIVNWKAVWQRDVEHGHSDVQDYHPGFYTDAYPFATGEYPYPVQESFETSDARRYLVATSAGNPMSVLQRRWPAEELMAEGFGTLASHKTQDARAWGSWQGGRWVVIVLIPRVNDDPQNPALGGGVKTVMGFAVWDGDQQNVGGRKHWSLLNELVLP